MYNVSQDFLNAIKQNGRTFKALLTIRDVTFDDNNIIELDLEENVNPDESFMLGGVGSATLTATITNPPSELIIEDAQVIPVISLLVNDSYEDVPLGVFKVDDIDVENNTIKITCYDNMMKLEQAYFSDLSYPTDINNVAQEICDKAGVELANELSHVQIYQIYGHTYREAVGFIASLLGGFARFNRDGKLEITSYTDSGISVDGNNYSKLTTNQKLFTTGKLSCKAGTTTDSEGNSVDNVLTAGSNGNEIQFENPIMTQSQLNSIYSKLQNLPYMPYSMEWWGNPALQAGDKITITDKDTNVYDTLVMNNKITYKGSITASASAVGKTETGQGFNSSGSIGTTIDAMVLEQANIKNALINKATIEDLQATNAKIDNLIVNTAQIADLSVTNAKIANATITGAKIEVATIDTANIKNAAITNALIDVGAVNTQQVADASITDAKIVSLTASKITAGTIDAGTINVTNLNADNITTGTINGKYIAPQAITDDKIANATITKAKISQAFVDDLDSTYATITNLNSAVGRIGILETNSATITDLNTANGNITNLTSNVATIQTLVNGNITSANMAAGAIQAGDATIANGAISSAMIISLKVSQLESGNISTNKFVVTSDSGNFKIQGNTLHVWDNSGKERISLGLNGTDYNLLVRGSDGNTVLFGTDGVTHAGITDGAVDDPKVATNANISGSKIEKESLVTQINGATTTLKSSKIKFDDTGQTLDVAFSSLLSTVSGLSSTTSSQGTSISAVQGAITSKVWQTDIASAIDAVQVGGRNLLLNTAFTKDTEGWCATGNQAFTFDTDTQYLNNNSMKIASTGQGGSSTGWVKIKNNFFKPNQKYSLSFYAKGQTGGERLHFELWGGSSYNTVLTNTWKRYTTSALVSYDGTPTNVSDCYFWLREADTINITLIKLEEGNKATDWSPAPEDTQSQIITINNNYSTLSQTVSGISSTVGSLQTSLDTTNGNVISVTNRVSTVEQSVSGLTSTITSVQQNSLTKNSASSTYATQTSVSNLSQTVNSLSSTISSNYLKIDDARNTYATQSTVSTLQQDLNGFSSTLSSVQTDVSNIQIGGTNLLFNTNFNASIANWGRNGSTIISLDTDNQYNGNNSLKMVFQSTDAANMVYGSVIGGIKNNQQYTVSFYAKGSVGEEVLHCELWGSRGTADFTLTNSWQKYTWNSLVGSTQIHGFYFWSNTANATINITLIKLEEGNKATAWSPAPEDGVSQAKVYTDGQISTVNSAISSIQTTTNSNTSSITQLQNSISSKVESSTFTSYKNSNDSNISSLQSRMSSAEQKITSDAIVSTVRSSTSYTNDLTGKVSTSEIISKINQSAESVTINASKINLNGYVMINSLQAGGSTVIDGGQITTGYIDSNRIQANSISVEKLNIGDFTNYLGKLNTSAWKVASGIVSSIVEYPSGSNQIHAICSTNNTWIECQNKIDVRTGDQFYWICDSFSNDNLAIFGFQVACYNSDGSFNQGASIINKWTGGQGTGTFTVPSGITRATAHITVITVGGDGTAQIIEPKMFKVNVSTLIANGAITTDKIVSQAITADKIAAHTITANEIASNTITAAQMSTGTITASSGIISSIDASKITTGTLSGDRIYGGTITGALLKTSNTSNYMYLHDQYIDFYKSGSKMATIGYDQSSDSQYLYPKLSLFDTSGGEHTVGMYRDGKLWSNINYFPLGVTFNGQINVSSNITTNGLTSYDDISAMYNIEAINGTITAGNGFRGLGRRAAYSESVSISTGSSEYIYHYLGYYPIVALSGTIGNVIVTYVHQSSSCLRVYCYSGGGATWNGVVYLY